MTPYALLTEFFPPDHGGIQASLGPLSSWLGDACTVIAPQPAHPSERRIIRSQFSGRFRPRWLWLVPWLYRAQRQGLHTAIFGHLSSAVVAAWLVRWTGLRYGLLVHGQDILSFERRPLLRWLTGTILRQASFVGVNSGYIAERVRHHGVHDLHIIQTHPFILHDRIVSTQPAPLHGHRLITVSRLVPRKNIATTIRAFPAVVEHFPDATFTIVGDGPELPRLQKIVKELTLEQKVIFHVTTSEEEKWRLLQESSLFIMAPIIRESGTDVEGLGLVYLEAATCGVPIIASDTGGVRDAVLDGQTGVFIDPSNTDGVAQAIIDLWQQPSRMQQYGRAGRQLVAAHFDEQVCLRRLDAALLRASETKRSMVSVLIPAYQAAATITATLDALFKQTWKNLETIVVDDGSTDGTDRVLNAYRQQLTVVSQRNLGAPAARNRGASMCHGRYLLFLDADTILQPDAIECMVAALEQHPEAAFAYSNFTFGWKEFRLFEFSVAKLRQKNYIHTTSLMRRDVAPHFDESLKRFQDWDLWLTLAASGQYGMWIPRNLFRVQSGRRGIRMSTWLPSFAYRLPFIGQGKGNRTIAAYRQAEQIIRQKHHL